MSKSAHKASNSSRQSGLLFEYVDRRGQLSQLSLGNETQRLYMASKIGPLSGLTADEAAQNPVMRDADEGAQSLTIRQWQVCDLLIAGLSSKQIAYELSISPRTVEIHRADVMRKMGVRNAASLVRLAMLAA
jgi:FixJ family two-component response regulator